MFVCARKREGRGRERKRKIKREGGSERGRGRQGEWERERERVGKALQGIPPHDLTALSHSSPGSELVLEHRTWNFTHALKEPSVIKGEERAS